MSTSNLDVGKVAFDLPKNRSNIIKVIGVGGGGGNAVTYMYSEGIKGVDYVICNTDSQDLEKSQVENKIQLGMMLTEGLGAGNNPEVGEKAAEESLEEIKRMLDSNTKMVFITAGMGGGTGTGAAPVIAKLAKEMGILTVGLVTTPFRHEGPKRLGQAQAGVEKLRKNVDSLIVINNNKLTEIYGDFGYRTGLAKANEVLLKGVKGMAEVISRPYTINIDFNDARNVLKDSGTAIMGAAIAEGENRALEAVSAALNSPLLNDNSIAGAKNTLLLVLSGKREATFSEMDVIKRYIQEQSGGITDIIEGVGDDDNLGDDAISITVIATGFATEMQNKIVSTTPKFIVHTLGEEQTATHELPLSDAFEKPIVQLPAEPLSMPETLPISEALPTPKEEPGVFGFLVDYEVVEFEEKTFTIIDKPTEQKPKPTSKPPQVTFVPEPQPVVKEDLFTTSYTHESPTEISVDEEPKIYTLKIEDSQEVPAPKKETPKTIVNENGEIIHTLGEYTELERQLTQATNKNQFTSKIKPEIKREEVKSSVDKNGQTSIFSDEETILIDPLHTRIPESMTKRTRPEELKRYNHSFNDGGYGQPSRTSVSKDALGEPQIRSNNSFLHDNVD
ncbi:MAG: cell division protein FtsZ [Capnocytophaga sp.]|nr:cell division protein FtsZ [Capnocytophaga sp.]